MPLAEVNASGLQHRLHELVASVAGDGRRVLRTEMAKLIEDLARSTTSPNRQSKRISRDFYQSFRAVKEGPPPDLKELYRVLDSYGQGGRRLRTGAQFYYVERRMHRARIGFLAAGWYGGGNPTGAKKPSAAANQPVLGDFQTEDTATHYQITVTNKVGFARHMRGLTIIVQKAVNRRAGSIARNMEIMRLTGKPYQFR